MEELIDTVMTWRHSGFNVFCGPRIQPGEHESMENLTRYTCPPQIVSSAPAVGKQHFKVCLGNVVKKFDNR